MGFEPQAKRSARPKVEIKIYFDLNQSTINANDSHSLRQLAELKALIRKPELAGARWLIEGHTDRFGSEGNNLILSQRRAETVVKLITQSQPNLSVTAKGRGEEEASGEDGTVNSADRKVVIVLLDD